MRRTTLFFFIPLWLMAETPRQPESSSGYHPKPIAYGEKMMVVSANRLASEAGFAILKQGGHAIDAAIAMQMALNVVEPQSSGIGGGAFLLCYRKIDNHVYAYDGRETAPKAVNALLFCDEKGNPVPFDNAILGGKAVGVPGLLKMLEKAHREHGRLPWKALFQSAITLADQGFPISPRLHRLITKRSDLSTFDEARDYLFEENGRPKAEGALLKNPRLAETLRLIANHGTDPFYKGDLAKEIVKTVQTCPVNPGVLAYEDLAAYSPIMRKPVRATYRDYHIYGFPPPSGGGIAVLQILGMLQQHDLRRYQPDSSALIHLFSQANALAFADRDYYVADPDFFSVPSDRLIHPAYLYQRGKGIDKKKALPASHGDWPSQTTACCPFLHPSRSYENPSTSHLCVIDGEGNAVSMTTSIEHAFGSTLMVKGFFLNNQLTDFSFIPEKEGKKTANRVEPGKRPMSSMAPMLVFHKDSGQLVLTLGSGGGSSTISYVAQTLLGILDLSLNIQEAIDLPHAVAIDKTMLLEEKTLLHGKLKSFEQMGYQIKETPLNSSTHGIHITPKGLMGGADPRREGAAIGE